MRHSFKHPETIAASAARTASTEWTHSPGTSGGVYIINATASAATPSVVFTIKGVDPVSGATWDILASSAVTGTGTTVLKIHPALTASANAVAKDMLPAAVKVVATAADADSLTYSIGFSGVQ